MNKNDLKSKILAAFSEEEWAALAAGKEKAPVSDFNREILLRLREQDEVFSGEADDNAVAELYQTVAAFLESCWSDEPGAHAYVLQACAALAFLYQIPLHPQNKVHYESCVRNGKAKYFCPMREEKSGSVCLFCPAETTTELENISRSRCSEAAASRGPVSALVMEEIFRAGFQDAGIIPTGELIFYPDVRKPCEETRCGGYGRSWACPPATGTLEECRERVLRFGQMQLFSKAYLLADSMDFSCIGSIMKDFKERSRTLNSRLRQQLPGILVLSNEGCGRCKACTWPEAPCRFPEELLPAIEGYGFVVSELAGKAGIPYQNGKNTVTFFGAVVYEEKTDSSAGAGV